MTRLAPIAVKYASSSPLAVAMTVAPACAASCTAYAPTAPAPPWIRSLSLSQVTVSEESLPCSLGDHRDRCRFLKRQVRRLLDDGRRLDGHVLRVRTRRAVAKHGITWRKCRDITADLVDDTGKLVARYPRQVNWEDLP